MSHGEEYYLQPAELTRIKVVSEILI
ncbi:hypothetical protein BOS5A_230152 [Bosea sp. EC-HK365B]|nr:hypothetical protein BOS5A_230152 [Bosea sp. EC-HK365B]